MLQNLSCMVEVRTLIGDLIILTQGNAAKFAGKLDRVKLVHERSP